MRKAKLLLITAMTAVSITACGSKTDAPAETTAAATEAATTAKAETTEAKAAETTKSGGTETTAAGAEESEASSESVTTIGELDPTAFGTPVLVTSFGQSTDAAMIDTVMKKLGVDYTYLSTATADDIGDHQTVIICVGASTKGLGAAGISEEEESARAEAFMEGVKATDAKIVLCHIGGESRRGGLSDTFIDMVIGDADYMIVRADGNADNKFTDAAEGAGVPLTSIQSTKDTIAVFTELFAE